MLKEKFNYTLPQSGHFQTKLEHFFSIFEKGRGDLPFPFSSYAPEKTCAEVFIKGDSTTNIS